MNHDEYRAAVLDVAYLAACAVNGTVPDAEWVGQMDLETLYQAADRHLLTGITAMALESAGVKDAAFTQAKGKAIRKVAAFDVERAAVLAKLEEAGIWHMPLKGSVMKDLYPKIGMRQMADNDILYDASRTRDVRAIMEGLGFSADLYTGRSLHEHYFKPPVCNFEMHRALFEIPQGEKLTKYYQNVKERLILDEGSISSYHFSNEDCYIYMLAHEFKHYSRSGTGLRSILDIYVYLKKRGATLDWSYIAGELDKLGIADFEAENRSLACHLFDGEELTAQDQEVLNYLFSSGTYGNTRNWVLNQMDQYGRGFTGKVKYVFHRLFLPMDVVRAAYPLFARIPVLLPFLPFYRAIRGLKTGRSRILTELKILKDHK